MDVKKKKLGFKLILFSMLLLPGLQVLFIIGCNSDYLIRFPFYILISVLSFLTLVGLIYGIKIFIKNRGANKRRLRKWIKIVLSVFMSIYILGCVTLVTLLYGPNDRFRTWLITTAMQTMNHQYFCKWFYNQDTINSIMNNNYVLESGESTDTSLVNKKSSKWRKEEYANEYEKEILDVDDDTKYKIIEFEINGVNGHLAAIYDPSMVKLAVTKYLGVRGQYVTAMAGDHDAILAINGGGFYDPGNSSAGGTPNGITISDGKIITNGQYGTNTQGGGIIGFTNDDILVLLKYTSAQEAINMGVRDAITWGPFLIVNGEPSFIKGNGGWGYAARSAIGQREDGIVLLLVIDSNAVRTKGADMVDLTEIMQNYGAINAANLDGGTSSVMVMPKKIAQKEYNASCNDYFTDTHCAINDPIDGELYHRTRPIADAWIVVEEDTEE